jgi:hypothetical protein
MFRLAGRFVTQAEARDLMAKQEKQARIATEKARLEAKMRESDKEFEANRRIATEKARLEAKMRRADKEYEANRRSTDKRNKTKAGVKATRMDKTSPKVNSLNKKKK